VVVSWTRNEFISRGRRDGARRRKPQKRLLLLVRVPYGAQAPYNELASQHSQSEPNVIRDAIALAIAPIINWRRGASLLYGPIHTLTRRFELWFWPFQLRFLWRNLVQAMYDYLCLKNCSTITTKNAKKEIKNAANLEKINWPIIFVSYLLTSISALSCVGAAVIELNFTRISLNTKSVCISR
jgi:hypothetical protein